VKRFIFLFFCLFSACNTHMVTMDRFQEVSLGSTVGDLKEKFGAPYAVHKKGEGVLEYEYVERISTGDRLLYLRRYFFDVQDGKVTSKRAVTDREVPLDDRNAFDLQTSQNVRSF
jgi:hypothetical protein